jgi:nitrogen fixation/metabolism regulation signal transduction histidine kinase
MKALTNPIVLRMLFGFAGMTAVFLVAFLMIRYMRQSLVESPNLPGDGATSGSFPLHTYHAVIQQLKQQKHELLTFQQAERRRAKTSENISAALLTNLSIGVMFFAPNGLIRQANPAARELLGFASPMGMSAGEIFSSTKPLKQSSLSLVEMIQSSVRQPMPLDALEMEHVTPGGDFRILRITVTSVRSSSGDVLGAACLIDDRTEMEKIRKEQEMHGEMSAEMALELRSSLATISGYGRQLAVSRDPDLARQLATDIASEASHLDHTIGGFLAGTRANAARAGSTNS